MQAPTDDDVEYLDYPLQHWQPLKIMSECWRDTVKLPFWHDDVYVCRQSPRHCQVMTYICVCVSTGVILVAAFLVTVNVNSSYFSYSRS